MRFFGCFWVCGFGGFPGCFELVWGWYNISFVGLGTLVLGVVWFGVVVEVGGVVFADDCRVLLEVLDVRFGVLFWLL